MDGSSKRLSSSLGDLNRSFMAVRNIMGLLKWPALIAAAGLASQAIGALAAGAVALAGSLGPLTGLLAAIPVGLGALLSSIGVVSLAFKDMKKAMDGNAEAIKNLTPEARAFAKELKGLAPILKELRQAAQQGLFPGLQEALKTVLTKENLAAVKNGLRGIGEALGDAAVSMAKVFGTKAFSSDLTKIFKEFESVIRAAGIAGGNFAKAIVNIVIAAKPLTAFLTSSLVALSKWASNASSAARASGDLQRFFEGTVQTLKAWGAILGPLGSALLNIFKAAKPLTDAILKDLAGVTKEFQAWTASASGQNTLANYFTQMKEPLYEIARLVRDVVKAFFELSAQPGVAPLIRQIRTELLPALVTLVSTTTQTLGPALVNLFTHVATLLASLAGATGPLLALVKIFDGIARGLQSFLNLSPQLKTMVIDFASIVAIIKALSFASAITGAKGLLAALGLVATQTKAVGTASQTAAASQVGGWAVAGAGVEGVTKKVGGLRGALQSLSLMRVVVTVFLAVEGYKQIKDLLESLGADFQGITPGGDSLGAFRAKPGVWLDAQTGARRSDSAELEKRYQRREISRTGEFTSVRKNEPGSSADRAGPVRGTPASKANQVQIPTWGGAGSDVYGKHHDQGRTTGLHEWGPTAHDFMQNAGTEVLAPENGYVSDSRPFNSKDKGLWGAAIYYQGTESGALYYIKHINSSHSPVGTSHRRGDVIATVAHGTAGGDHVHVGVKDPSGTPVKTPPGALTPDVTGGATPPSKGEIAAVRAPIAAVQKAARKLSDDIPEIGKDLAPKLKRLMADIANGVNTDEALAKIKEAGERLKHALANMVSADTLRDKLPALKKTIMDTFSGKEEAALLKRFEGVSAMFRKFFKDGVITDTELAALQLRMEQFTATVMNAKWAEAIRDKLGGARKELKSLFEGGFIDEVTFAKTNAQITKLFGMIDKALADGFISKKEREAIKTAWDGITQVIDEGTERMNDAAIKLQGVSRLFKKLWKDGIISADDAAQIREAAGQIEGAVADAIEAAAAAVEKGYAEFDTAWAAFRSHIEDTFSQMVIGKFQLTIDWADAYEQQAIGAQVLQTATEKWNAVIAAGMDEGAVVVKAAVERVLAANAEYTAAIISQDRDRIKAAIDERIAANAALTALAGSGISEQAQAVLAAGQELISAHQTIGASQVAEQKKIWEDTKREALAGVLKLVDDVGARLRDGKITWAQAVGEIGVALTAAGMDASTAADLLGQNVAGSMGKAAVAIETAVGKLTTAIQDLVRALGGAVTQAKGQYDELVAWERALAIRSDALNKKYGLGTYAGQGPTAAGAAEIAAGGGPAPSAVTSSGGSATPTVVPGGYDFPESRPATNPVAGGPVPYYAEGGVSWFPQLAMVGENFPEAHIPLPTTMAPALKSFLVTMAEGGWRRSAAPVVNTRTSRPDLSGLLGSGGLIGFISGIIGQGGSTGSGGGGSGGGGGGANPRDRGYPDFHVTVVAPVSASLITSEHELGRAIADIATPAIRDEFMRLFSQGVGTTAIPFTGT